MNKLSTIFLFLLVAACAHKQSVVVGLASDNKSFVRQVVASPELCVQPEVETLDGQIQKLSVLNSNFGAVNICSSQFNSQITKQVKIGSDSVRIPNSIQKVVLMGDTGCRVKHSEKGGLIQDCSNEQAWPFRKLAKSALSEDADLVIHVGDYHYREACADKEKCKKFADTITYEYPAWKADFLEPAKGLLSEKPFIFVRGNHEDCRRAYAGYDKILNPNAHDVCVDNHENQYTQVGDLLIVNFDMASVDDKALDEKSDSFKSLQKRYNDAYDFIKKSSAKEVWFVTHKPIWGMSPYEGKVFPVNVNLQKIVERKPLPRQVTLTMAGHIHDFQLVKQSRPVQLVVGQSGSALDPAPQVENQRFKMPSGYEIFSPTIHGSQFGYVVLEKASQGWIAKVKNIDGKTEHTCELWNLQKVCD